MKNRLTKVLALLTALTLLFATVSCSGGGGNNGGDGNGGGSGFKLGSGDKETVSLDSVDVSDLNGQLDQLFANMPPRIYDVCPECGGSRHTDKVCGKCGGTGKEDFFGTLYPCVDCIDGYERCPTCVGGAIPHPVNTQYDEQINALYQQLADLLKARSERRQKCKRSGESLSTYCDFCGAETVYPAKSGDLYGEACYDFAQVAHYADLMERCGFRFSNAYLAENVFLRLEYLRGKEVVYLTSYLSGESEFISRYVTADYTGSLFPEKYNAAADVSTLTQQLGGNGGFRMQTPGVNTSPGSSGWCARCYGMGTCPDCYGSGTVGNPYLGGDYHTCTTCGGTGKCPKCHGR